MGDDETVPLDEGSRELPLGRLRLLVMWDEESVALDLPPEGELKIGRAKQADVVIEHASVSRSHAAIEVRAGVVTVRDLGSHNGTRVNGAKLAKDERARLRPGALVEVGRAVLFLQPREVATTARAEVEPALPSAPPGLVIPQDGPMRQVYRLVAQVARSKLSVLLLGETGVGKELVAEAVHRWSPRSKGPFVRLNCASLNETLLESELFGHEKGAFTGAANTKIGHVEAAHGGTLFLDEIGEIPLSTQVKLLRVLEAREITRVGATDPRGVDIRLVAATHRDLEAAMSAGTFRQDFYFRIHGVAIGIPPLRARVSEIAKLAAVFANRACAESQRREVRFSKAAVSALEAYAWPGNVRELKNAVERAVALTTGDVVEPEHLFGKSSVAPPSSETTLGQDLSEIERRRIEAALERAGGNQSQVARELGIPRRTLLRRLKEYGLGRK